MDQGKAAQSRVYRVEISNVTHVPIIGNEKVLKEGMIKILADEERDVATFQAFDKPGHQPFLQMKLELSAERVCFIMCPEDKVDDCSCVIELFDEEKDQTVRMKLTFKNPEQLPEFRGSSKFVRTTRKQGLTKFFSRGTVEILLKPDSSTYITLKYFVTQVKREATTERLLTADLPERRSSSTSSSSQHPAQMFLPEPGPLPEPQDKYSLPNDHMISSLFDLSSILATIRREFTEHSASTVELQGHDSVVLIGEQNVGKSTIIEYICGAACTFRRDGLGTKRPIVYHVKHAQDNSTKLRIHSADAEPVDYEALMSFLESKQQTSVPITEDELHIYVESPLAHTMTIYDLPGLIAENNGDDATTIYKIARKYAASPSAVLLVVRKGDDWESVGSAHLEQFIGSIDPEFKRTVVASSRMLNNDTIKLKQQYFFEGYKDSGKSKGSFGTAPKFFVDVALDDNRNAIRLPVDDPQSLQRYLRLAEDQVRQGFMENENVEEGFKLKLEGSVVGITALVKYLQFTIVGDAAHAKEKVETLRSTISKLLEKIEEAERERFPFGDSERERRKSFSAALDTFCNRISHMHEMKNLINVAQAGTGYTSLEENEKCETIYADIGLSEKKIRALKERLLDLNAEIRPQEHVTWQQDVALFQSNCEERLCMGRALVRLREEGVRALKNFPLPFANDISDVKRWAQGMEDFGTTVEGEHMAMKASNSVLQQVYDVFFEHYLQREYVILRDMITKHVWETRTFSDEIYGVGAILLERSSELRAILVEHSFEYLRNHLEEVHTIRHFITRGKLSQFNEVDEAQREQPSKNSTADDTVTVFNQLLTMSKEKIRSDFNTFQQYCLARPFQRYSSGLFGGKMKEYCDNDIYVQRVFNPILKDHQKIMDRIHDLKQRLRSVQVN